MMHVAPSFALTTTETKTNAGRREYGAATGHVKLIFPYHYNKLLINFKHRVALSLKQHLITPRPQQRVISPLGLIPSGSRTETVSSRLISHTRYVASRSHLVTFHQPNSIW